MICANLQVTDQKSVIEIEVQVSIISIVKELEENIVFENVSVIGTNQCQYNFQ